MQGVQYLFGLITGSTTTSTHSVPSSQDKYPQLLQINTRTFLYDLSQTQKGCQLNDLSEETIVEIVSLGYNYVWLLGVWQTGPTSIAVSRKNEWLSHIKEELPDLKVEEDVCGSPFAICEYTLNTDFGTPTDLIHLKERLNAHGLGLVLDFVPNHVGLDHPWIQEHPEFFIVGTEEDFEKSPRNWIKIGSTVFAHGKDPYYDGWTDTLQLNYRHQGLRDAMCNVLTHISTLCDGLRCDMTMLLLPSVIEQTWGTKSHPYDNSPPVDTPFWSPILSAIHQSNPSFIFIAEVYWDLEWEMQQQGFDYTYDKRLYDRLLSKSGREVFMHLHADEGFMRKSVRFLENHDEKRAATAFGEGDMHKAAAVITFCAPGMRFFTLGQMEGFKSQVSMHIGRKKPEPINTDLHSFYTSLFGQVLLRNEIKRGHFSLCTLSEAWNGNLTFNNFIAYTMKEQYLLLVIVNYADYQGQCFVSVSKDVLVESGVVGEVVLRDLMSDVVYRRDVSRLYVDMKAWGYHVFLIQNESESERSESEIVKDNHNHMHKN